MLSPELDGPVTWIRKFRNPGLWQHGKVAMREKAELQLGLKKSTQVVVVPVVFISTGLTQACANILKVGRSEPQQRCRSYRFHLVLFPVSSVQDLSLQPGWEIKKNRCMRQVKHWAQKSKAPMLSFRLLSPAEKWYSSAHRRNWKEVFSLFQGRQILMDPSSINPPTYFDKLSVHWVPTLLPCLIFGK